MKISNKNKQYLSLTIKILVVVAAFYFIYAQLRKSAVFNWEQLQVLQNTNTSILLLIFIVYLSFQNRFLEILKWQNLVYSFQNITVSEATKQVLAALTLGMVTPNGIGEYAGKALYFDKTQTKNIIFLNVICNGVQLILSVAFGLVGLLYLGYTKWVLAVSAIVCIVIVTAFLLKKTTIKGYSLSTFVDKINDIPKAIHQRNIFFGLLRYLTFSHQYYFLFLIFGVQFPYFTMMAAIAAVYFVSSSLPAFQFLDFAVKGSVAVFFMGKIGVNDWIVVLVAAIFWFLNVVLPVCVGIFYVLNYKIDNKR